MKHKKLVIMHNT